MGTRLSRHAPGISLSTGAGASGGDGNACAVLWFKGCAPAACQGCSSDPQKMRLRCAANPLSHYSPFGWVSCYDARATASPCRFLQTGGWLCAVFFISPNHVPAWLPVPTPHARRSESISQSAEPLVLVASSYKKPNPLANFNLFHQPLQLPHPSHSHPRLFIDFCHHICFCSIRQLFTQPKCLPSPPTRSPPPRPLPLPPRLPRRRMLARRPLPPARRRSAPRRGRRLTPPTSTRVSHTRYAQRDPIPSDAMSSRACFSTRTSPHSRITH